jgi:hypothetical protein
MAPATATLPLPTASQADSRSQGFPGLRCPLCGQEDCVTLNLQDVHTFSCTECSEDIPADDARTYAQRWLDVLAWTALAPVAE